MKISISVPGRFHAFALAKQLYDKDFLHCLVTSYPAFEVKKYGIPAKKVKSIISKEFIQRIYKKITGKYPEGLFLNNWFDKVASYRLPVDSDIYIIWAGFGLHTMNRLKQKNPKAIFIIERGSSHIEVQNELLSIFEKDRSPVNISVIKKEKEEYETCDYISVPSAFARLSFINKGINADKLFVNNYGVDLSKFNNASYENDDKPQNLFTIGYVGSIDSRKNVKGIINAIKILIQKGYTMKLVMAGSINNDEVSSDFFKKLPFVDYRGILPESKLHEVYNEMDIFVLNSIEDGFGMVLLQAMAMGVVPIATYNTGGPDIIKNGINGFLIKILDDNALANYIELLIKSPEEKVRMGNAARETVKSGFTWADYGNRAIEFYKRVLTI